MELVNVPTKKYRRQSLKGLAGKSAFKLVTTCSGVGSFLETNSDIADILIQLTQPRLLAVLNMDDTTKEFEMFLDFGEEQWDCVGIMISFDYRTENGRGRHAKPYIKIGTDWFDGDNEVGYLRKLKKEPTINMPIKQLNSYFPDAEIVKAALFYKERHLVTERTGATWQGHPTFAQLGTSCGPDALISILMYADGFYEIFNQGYYHSLKSFIDSRFNYNSVKAKPYTQDELIATHDMLIQHLPFYSKNDTSKRFNYTDKTVQDALSFLIYNFIRYYTIESMTVRNYEVSNNSSGGKRKTRRKR